MGQSLQILVKETESQVEPLKLCFQENLETKLLSISPAFQACAKPYSVFPVPVGKSQVLLATPER